MRQFHAIAMMLNMIANSQFAEAERIPPRHPLDVFVVTLPMLGH